MDSLILAAAFTTHLSLPPVLLYIGPDLFMPLASALAAIAGVLLMFWTRVKIMVATAWNAVFRRNKEPHA